MSLESPADTSEETSTSLEAIAGAFAREQCDLDFLKRPLTRTFAPPSAARGLELARGHLAASESHKAALPKAAEWFLDNYYLIRRVARQADDELPRGFARHLPRLASGPERGRPRIDAIARALVVASEVVLDAAVLRRFVEAYQEVSALTIAELWALPTLLRATVLQHLLQFLDALDVPVGAGGHRLPGTQAPRTTAADLRPMSLEPGLGVERSIQTLRALDVVDWKALFQETSRVEAILATDPTRVYPQMDFETRDAYRKVVEALAWGTLATEVDVATMAVGLARAAAPDPRRGHVGYYLVADGRATLERQLGYHATGLERVRRVATGWPTASYLVPLALLTTLPLLAVAVSLVVAVGARPGVVASIAVALLVAVVPVSSMAIAVLHAAFARLLPPRTLPKLDLDKGLPADARTLVVMPTLLGRAADVTAMLRRIELHYLSNPDARLELALLTDAVDARTEVAAAQTSPLLESACRGIEALNVKHAKDGRGPFHLLHRTPRWNESEERTMGWERKRGKLDELNRLLRGDPGASFSRRVGDPAGLLGIRFVITLDSDTELPLGAARRLVGVLSHPLNRAVVDPRTGRVVAGYTVIQPCISTSPSSSRLTPFSRAFAGDVGFDIYTHASSEIYQDLFGAGIYVGKGIYDVDAFMRSVEGLVPENALVSHDLFEGVQGRTALATDIVLFESYPSNYATYVLRMHRWLRGDWQLVPWLFSRVPSATGHPVRNKLAFIDRWKIADNLRRSLMSPLSLVLLALGWAWLPGSALLWTAATLAILVAPFSVVLSGGRRRGFEQLARCGLGVAFLPYEASVVVDAIARVLVRKTITRKYLLEWTSSAQTSFGVEARSSRGMFWRTMIASPLVASALALLLACLRPAALLVAGPLLLLWVLAPELALWISRPSRARADTISADERSKLRLLARRTWRFFDVFVGPDDQWLPIDNHQEVPHEQTAHRTSPTNIGLMLLATLSAYDFGYIGPSELALRLRRTFDSITRLQHYQGHLFNWYDTKNLQPLLPRYVSTVDSGNLAGCLVALKHGCTDVAVGPVLRAAAWDGLRDSIDLLEEVVESGPTGATGSLRTTLTRMQSLATHARAHLREGHATLKALGGETSADLDRELLAFLETGAHRHEADFLHALRTSIDRLRQQLVLMRRELDALVPWLALADDVTALGIAVPEELNLDEVPAVSRRLRSALHDEAAERRRRGAMTAELAASVERLDEAFRSADVHATALGVELLALAHRADEEVRGMDFKLLYDEERRLFRIGYDATSDQVDAHYYDLLASEARLASYLAIVKRDVPESHWLALGRPMTHVTGAPLLLSWGGTMFEYLMPGLLMRSEADTLLARTSALAVDAQIAYGKKNKEPWGVSESAYARLDAGQTYQYRAFGVPGLGFKRGLEEDRVVTPYASLLAVSIRPRAVVDNIRALEAMGMVGTYGLFEALDLTAERAGEHPPHDHPFAVVRSYMAHHQGMLLVALGNFLNPRSMVDRFHADAAVETAEFLLNEYAPGVAPKEWPLAESAKVAAAAQTPLLPRAPDPWPGEPGKPHAFVLSNGSLSTLMTGAGGGGLRWQGLALTRYEPDATHDDDGVWFTLRDEDTAEVWRATSTAGRTTYAMHKAAFHLREHGISVHVDVAVARADDVEVRQLTLHNETGQARRLTVTSAGRPVIFDAKKAPTHPAFSSMFVESELVADLEGLLFARRPQSPDEEPAVLVHSLVRDGATVSLAGYESDRGAFLGRGARSPAPTPLVTEEEGPDGRVGPVLDPVMSLMASVELEPRGSVTLAFVTTIARSREVAIALARKYGSMHAVGWAFLDAEQESPRRLERTKVSPALVPTIQRLFSAILFADPTLRVPASARAASPPCQHRLWERGISGDEPIVLVHVHDPESSLLADILAVQRYLRSCGVSLDLVLVDAQPSGYANLGSGMLRTVLARHDASEWLDRHGGVFVIAADQVPEGELLHLEACARIVLDTRDGNLAARLERVTEGPPKLPQFQPTLFTEPAPGRRERPLLLLDNGIGGFSSDGREYVLEVGPGQATPAPWCNVLANPVFGCLVSESSLGTSWSLNAGENRLTPWRNDAVLDTPSEVLYLRDEETAAVWSPTPLPAGQGVHTLVRHGAGYTTYERESHGLVQEMTVFVPPDGALKIVRLRVKNTLDRHRRLTATYYAEWVLGSRRKRQTPYVVSEVDRAHACLLATCDWSAEFAGRVAFVAAKGEVHGFTSDRTEFLGTEGDYARPEALRRWGLSGRVDLGADPCAALQVHLDLAPGQELETHFLLGQSSSRDEALALVARFRAGEVVETAWKDLHAYWDEILGTLRVKTPEPSMDLMLNRWLLYQTLSSRVFGRTGFYQSSGAFGYRDQLQDVLALLHSAPALARAHILRAATHQFEEGDVLHWWHPPSGRGVRTRCSDDMSWLPYVTGEYVAATGDTGILDEPVPFLAGKPLALDEHDRYAQYEVSALSAPLFEHCRRALEVAVTAGAHGLPLMRDGDWNDGMSRVGVEGRGESVWLGWFLCAVMERFATLSSRHGDVDGASHWRARGQSLRQTVEDVSWDGAWYLRAYHDDGSLVGSAQSQECRIDSIAQSWAVLSRSGSEHDARARQAVRAADEQLVRETDRLVLLFWPPFDSTPHDPGYIRGYPPGIRENGGQYTHAATWLGFAHAALRDGERAERIFRLLNPALRVRTLEDCARYRVEPYALAGDVYSCDPWVGGGGWTWYTGSAAWMWRLGAEEILGLRKENGDLKIDPCIPPHWEGFEAWVRSGDRCIHVTVVNPEHVTGGIAAITLDGAPLASNRIRLDPDATGTCEVHVRLGSSALSSPASRATGARTSAAPLTGSASSG